MDNAEVCFKIVSCDKGAFVVHAPFLGQFNNDVLKWWGRRIVTKMEKEK